VRGTRESAAILHSMPVRSPSSDCLDDDAIAALADGAEHPDSNVASDKAHVADCVHCRARLAAVMRLMDDAAVKSEIDALQAPRQLTLHRESRRPFTIPIGLAAAAAAAIVLLGPLRSGMSTDETQDASGPRREAAITTTTAPAIVSPVKRAERSDSLRWTSVPQADLYRIRIWDTTGVVVWTTDTRATRAELPPVLQSGTTYLWEVSARTGWDRWVSSDLGEFAILARRSR